MWLRKKTLEQEAKANWEPDTVSMASKYRKKPYPRKPEIFHKLYGRVTTRWD